MNILVAEDERRYAEPLLALLEKNGCNPILKATPEAVCDFVKSDNPIDIALLDLMLGKDCSVQDGIGTVLAVRQAHPVLPILLFTAHVNPESWE
jgi:DNA-binding response OmpR family regulator